MPYLNKVKHKPKIRQYKKENRNEIYQSKKWRILRNYYYRLHPLCEICLEAGKVTPADDVHHKDSFQNYVGDERIEKAFDENNLMSLCRKHHNELHKGNISPKGFSMDEYKKTHLEEFFLLKSDINKDK